jgi:hypothetical protein
MYDTITSHIPAWGVLHGGRNFEVNSMALAPRPQ